MGGTNFQPACIPVLHTSEFICATCCRRGDGAPSDALVVRVESGDDAVTDNSFSSERLPCES